MKFNQYIQRISQKHHYSFQINIIFYLIIFFSMCVCKGKSESSPQESTAKPPNNKLNNDKKNQIDFLNYTRDFKKKILSNKYTIDLKQRKKRILEKKPNINNFIQSYSRKDYLITTTINNKTIKYQKMYMHHGVNCWIEASLVCLLYYFNLEDWKNLFDNIEKVLLNHPFVKALESHNLPNYSAVSHGKLKDLFLNAKEIILKMKDPNCDPNFFDKDEHTNKKIKPNHLHKIVIFIRQVIVLNDAINSYYNHKLPMIFKLFNKTLLGYLDDAPGINNKKWIKKAQELSHWFLDLLKVVKNKIKYDTGIKSKIDNEIKKYFCLMKINNIAELIDILQKSLNNFENEMNNRKSILHVFLVSLQKINLDFNKLYSGFDNLLDSIKFSNILCSEENKDLLNMYFSLSSFLKSKVTNKYLIISILSKFNSEIDIFLKHYNNPDNHIQDLLAKSETIFKTWQLITGGGKWFWGDEIDMDSNFSIFFPRKFNIPDSDEANLRIKNYSTVAYPVAYLDNVAFKDYVYRVN